MSETEKTPGTEESDAQAVREAFLECYGAGEPERQQEMLVALRQRNPQMADAVVSLFEQLEGNPWAEKIADFEPRLQVRASNEVVKRDSAGPSQLTVLNQSVLSALKQEAGSLPHLTLDSGAFDDPVMKVGSTEIDTDWNVSGGRIRIDGEIARGGMGAILKGHDNDLGRDLAVKVLLNEHRHRPDVVKRFIEEAQIGGQLQHPGIAPVYELGQFSDRRPFFSMKLVKGKTLAALLAERTSLEEERIKFLGIFEQICQAVAYAHSRGVVHRDLKPSNVMVGAFGEVQVMDWGLAKVLAAGGVADEQPHRSLPQDESLVNTIRSSESSATVRDHDTPVGSATRMGSILGTPAYMPPEQAQGAVDHLDCRADVFALGAILCEILTGVPAYQRRPDATILELAIAGDTSEAYERLEQSTADPELIELTKQCLAKWPDDRPRNAQAVSARVAEYLESVEQKLRESELQVARSNTRAEEERKRRKVVMALALCAVSAVIAGAGGWLWVQETRAQLAKVKADAELVAANDRFQREQEIEAELKTAVMLADATEDLPSERRLSRAMESLGRAQQTMLVGRLSADYAPRLDQLTKQIGTLEASAKLVNRLQEIWAIEQEYFLQSISPSNLTVPEVEGEIAGDLTAMDAFANQITNPASLYEETFQDWGLSLDNATDSDWDERIGEMPTVWQDFLINSLYRWRQLLDEDYSLADWGSQSWQTLQPIEVTCEGTDKIKVLPEQSILVEEESLDRGYRVVLETNQTQISALRLEALLHDSLPNGGPGSAASGTFTFRGLKVAVAPRTNPQDSHAVDLVEGTADYADRTWPFQIHCWHGWGGGGEPHVAYYRLAEQLEHPDGFRVTITNEDHIDPSDVFHPLRHFRWSAANLVDPRPIRSALDMLLARVDENSWRRQLREAMDNGDLQQLMRLATDADSESQPAVISSRLVQRLLASSGQEVTQPLQEVQWRVASDVAVSSANGTRYVANKDGSLTATGPMPGEETTSIVIPAAPDQPSPTALRIELLPKIDGSDSFLGRETFVQLREVKVTQTDGSITRNMLSRLVADFPWRESLAHVVDNDLGSGILLKVPDEQRALYLVLDAEAVDTTLPLAIELATGTLPDPLKSSKNPGRFRISTTTAVADLPSPLIAAQQLLSRSVVTRPDDPLVHLQLANYYRARVPIRYDDAWRHAVVAASLTPSTAASRMLLELLNTQSLVGNPVLKELVREHIRNLVSRRGSEGDITWIEMSLISGVNSLYHAGRVEDAEELLRYSLSCLDKRADFLVELFARISPDAANQQAASLEKVLIDLADEPSIDRAWSRLGTVYLENRDDERAMEAFETAIRLGPESFAPRYQLGGLQMLRQNLKEAETLLREAIELEPSNAQGHALLGRILGAQEKNAEALPFLRKAVELSPAEVDLHLWLAELLRACLLQQLAQEGKKPAESSPDNDTPQPPTNPVADASVPSKEELIEELGAVLQRAVELAPERVDVLLKVGMHLHGENKLQRATEVFESVDSICRKNNDFAQGRHLLFLAVEHWRLGNHEAAVSWFTRGATLGRLLHPDSPQWNQNVKTAASLLQIDSERQEQLILEYVPVFLEELTAGIEGRPDLARRWETRGLAYFHLQQYPEAISDLSRAIELAPNAKSLYAYRAAAYEELGKLDLALADRQRCIELAPGSNSTHFEHAVVLRRLGRFQEALAGIAKGFNANPDSDDPWYPRAKAHALAGDIHLEDLDQPQQAIEEYEKALKLDPENDGYRAKLEAAR